MKKYLASVLLALLSAIAWAQTFPVNNLTVSGTLSGAGIVSHDASVNHVQTFANVSALRSFACLTNQQYQTRGFATLTDKGYGTYVCTSDTTTADNGCTVIASASYRLYLQHNGVLNVRQCGAKGDGTTADDAAFANALASGVGTIQVPGGNYLISTGNLAIGDNQNVIFTKGAQINAGANGITIFKTTTHAYGAQFNNATINANGKTGVVGFDLSNMRLQAAINNPSVVGLATGFIFRDGDFGLLLLNPSSFQTSNVVQIVSNDSNLAIINPNFDNETGNGGTGAGIGIDIQFGSGSNIGAHVYGGYVQGFSTCIQDAAFASLIDSTYFEDCSTADISFASSRNALTHNTQHFGPSEPAAIKARSSDSITIEGITSASGARTALLDFDSSNSNSFAYIQPSNASLNSGVVGVGINALPLQIKGSWTPVIIGSTSAGTGTYTSQTGRYTITSNLACFQADVAWSAHSGAGNAVLTGLPSALLAATTVTVPIIPHGLIYTGPSAFGTFNGTGTNLSLTQATAAGSSSLIPIAATGGLTVNACYSLN